MNTYELRPVTWNEVDDYESPVNVGDRIVLVKDDAVVVSTVKRTEGYAAGVIELENFVRVDLFDGWLLGVIPKAANERTSEPQSLIAELLEMYPNGCDGLGCGGWEDLIQRLREAVK